MMDKQPQTGSGKVIANLDGLLADLESVYKDIHAHPELSMQENGQRKLRRTTSAQLAMK